MINRRHHEISSYLYWCTKHRASWIDSVQGIYILQPRYIYITAPRYASCLCDQLLCENIYLNFWCFNLRFLSRIIARWSEISKRITSCNSIKFFFYFMKFVEIRFLCQVTEKEINFLQKNDICHSHFSFYLISMKFVTKAILYTYLLSKYKHKYT